MTEISCSSVYGIHTLESFLDLVATNIDGFERIDLPCKSSIEKEGTKNLRH